MPEELFDVYPQLGQRIDALCEGVPWCVTGVSALLHDDDAFYFELTKPKHWRHRADGTTLVGIGGIGGSIEPGETILECLRREVEEEIKASIRVESATTTHLVYEEGVTKPLSLPQREHPLPVLLTISRNLYRQDTHSDYGILSIATFLAQLEGKASIDDLYGLLIVPRDKLVDVMRPNEITLDRLDQIPGIRRITQEPLPKNTVFVPVWTGRSFQLLLQAGHLYDIKGVPR